MTGKFRLKTRRQLDQDTFNRNIISIKNYSNVDPKSVLKVAEFRRGQAQGETPYELNGGE